MWWERRGRAGSGRIQARWERQGSHERRIGGNEREAGGALVRRWGPRPRCTLLSGAAPDLGGSFTRIVDEQSETAVAEVHQHRRRTQVRFNDDPPGRLPGRPRNSPAALGSGSPLITTHAFGQVVVLAASGRLGDGVE